MGNKYFPHPMSSLCKPCLPSTPNLLFKINDWSRILKKTGTHNLVIFPFLLHMWQQLGWDKNHRIKVKYKRRIDETSHGYGKSTKLSSAASRCNTSRFLNLDTGLSFLRRSATLRKQWRVTRSTIHNPVTLLASGGCTADLVTTALMSLLRHKPPDMNGTQLVMVDYPTI